ILGDCWAFVKRIGRAEDRPAKAQQTGLAHRLPRGGPTLTAHLDEHGWHARAVQRRLFASGEGKSEVGELSGSIERTRVDAHLLGDRGIERALQAFGRRTRAS